MMTWEYRVFREEDGTYVIREVYYDNGSIVACTEKAVTPMGESLEELQKDIEWFKEALELPVLTLADIPSHLNKQHPKDRSKNLSLEQVRAELGLAKPSTRHRHAQRKSVTPVLVTAKKSGRVRVR
ncbi:MAG: hypothetical protein N2559_02220 [Anaerolineae bacterium]|nr:hypothetical protein [Anaerolineae bacterium]